ADRRDDPMVDLQEPATVRQPSCGDAEGSLPDPGLRPSNSVSSTKSPGEGLGHRVVGHFAVTRVREDRPPQTGALLSIQLLQTSVIPLAHQRILHRPDVREREEPKG